MRYRVLGRTMLDVSVVGIGAGPVPAVMIGEDEAAQIALVRRASELGINWIDTAAGYGEGRSEAGIGRALREVGAARMHVATKVRLTPEDLASPLDAVRRSLLGSLSRLGLDCVTLLQLHNGLTPRRGEIAASLTPADAVRAGEAMLRLRDEGLTRFVGLTGTGSAVSLAETITSGLFDTIQIPHHLLCPADAGVLAACRAHDLGVFAIRVYAGGALLGLPPSAHTLRTPYFPLELYERDRRRAEALMVELGVSSLAERAVRFALSADVPQVALIGLATPAQADEAAACVRNTLLR